MKKIWRWIKDHGASMSIVGAILAAIFIYAFLAPLQSPTPSDKTGTSTTTSTSGFGTTTAVVEPSGTNSTFPLTFDGPSNGHPVGITESQVEPTNAGFQSQALPEGFEHEAELQAAVNTFIQAYYLRDYNALADWQALNCAEALEGTISQEEIAEINTSLEGYIAQIKQSRDALLTNQLGSVIDPLAMDSVLANDVRFGYTLDCGAVNARLVISATVPWEQKNAYVRDDGRVYLQTPITLSIKSVEHSIEQTLSITPPVPQTEWKYENDHWVLVFFSE